MEGVCHSFMFPLTEEDCNEFPLKEKDCSEYSSEEDCSEFPSDDDDEACNEFPLGKKDCSESHFHGVTPLMHAAGKGYEQCVKDLVVAGADVNQTAKGGDTPLMWAARNGRENCLKELIGAEADVNLTDDDGDTALSSAVICIQKACFMELIEAGADVNKAGNKGNIPLMYAAVNPPTEYDTQYLEELIQAGADVNYTNRNGDTALTEAASKELSGCCMELIEAGADVNPVKNHWYSDILFIDAMWDSNVDILKKITAAGFDVNKDIHCGCTPLMWAASAGQTACVQELIESGADLNIVNCEGSSALIMTVERQRETFDHLLKAGADVNIVNKKGDTALTIAAGKGNAYMVKHLLKANCRINKMAGMRLNALVCHLIHCCRGELFRLLFAAGEMLEEDDGYGIEEPEELRMQLKTICRKAIRKHLLELDPQRNLFVRIPELGLPKIIKQYLLYNESIEEIKESANYDTVID